MKEKNPGGYPRGERVRQNGGCVTNVEAYILTPGSGPTLSPCTAADRILRSAGRKQDCPTTTGALPLVFAQLVLPLVDQGTNGW